MSRGAATLIAVLVLAFFAFLIARAPATMVAQAAQDAAPALSLDGVTGTAWRGRAAHARWRGIPLGTVDWRLSAGALLGGAARAHVVVGGAELTLDAVVSQALFGDRLRVTNADGIAPLAFLSRVSGARGPLEGTVVLVDVSLTIEGERVVAAEGRAVLRDTVVTVQQRAELGAFTLDLSAHEGWLQGEVSDDGGPLGIAGFVRAAPDRRWELDARVRARDRAGNLALVLSLLGTPADDGYHPLRLSGRY
ncbi:MAG: type II secretion system protein N [Gammaproteobacteria bacterium]